MGLHLPMEVAEALSNAIGNEQLFADIVRHAIAAGHLTKVRAAHFIVDYYERQNKLKRKLYNAARFTTRHIQGVLPWLPPNNSNGCTSPAATDSVPVRTSN